MLTLTIQAVPTQSGSLTYTGSTQNPTWKGYDSSMMTIGGVTSGINAGTYTATFTPIGKYVWTDGTQEAKMCRGRLAEPRSRMCRHRPVA